MTARDSGGIAAVVARQRGRVRLRKATIAVGAASLVAAGAVAYHLPGTATTAVSKSISVPGTGTSATVHTTSGGSGIAAATTTGGGTSRVARAGTGTAHATSGGS